MAFDKHTNLKYRYDNRPFWRKGYAVDIARRNKKNKYIKNQLQEDRADNHMTLKEYVG